MVSIYKGRLKNELTPISGCFSFSDDLLSFVLAKLAALVLAKLASLVFRRPFRFFY